MLLRTLTPRASCSLLGCALLLVAGCRNPLSRAERAQPTATGTTPSAPLDAAPGRVMAAPEGTSRAAAATEAAAAAVPSVAAVPFEVCPGVQDKDVIADGQYHHHIYEPGVMVGPERRFVKAFDCTGARHADVVGACVRFASCDGKPSTDAATPNLVATFSCRGPAFELLLVREGDELVFRAADATHPLASLPMTRVELPPSATLQVGALARKYVSANVDL